MATIIRKLRSLSFTAVDSTPLDGTTSGRTYQSGDRLASACIPLDQETDAVTIIMDGTGSDGHLAIFNIYGYGLNGPAERIYHTVTATLGTAIAGTGKLYAEQFSGTDVHTSTIGIKDSGAAGNTVAKVSFDTSGLRYLYFEPETFTNLTAITFHVREWGTI